MMSSMPTNYNQTDTMSDDSTGNEPDDLDYIEGTLKGLQTSFRRFAKLSREQDAKISEGYEVSDEAKRSLDDARRFTSCELDSLWDVAPNLFDFGDKRDKKRELAMLREATKLSHDAPSERDDFHEFAEELAELVEGFERRLADSSSQNDALQQQVDTISQEMTSKEQAFQQQMDAIRQEMTSKEQALQQQVDTARQETARVQQHANTSVQDDRLLIKAQRAMVTQLRLQLANINAERLRDRAIVQCRQAGTLPPLPPLGGAHSAFTCVPNNAAAATSSNASTNA